MLFAFGVAAVPVVGMLLLAVFGWAAPAAALILLVLTLAAAAALGMVWRRNRTALSAALAAVADGIPPVPVPRPFRADIERLSRRLAAHSAALERRGQADAAVVDGLPDPLVVLGRDHALLRANAAARAAFGADLGAVLRHPGLLDAIGWVLAHGRPRTEALSLPVPVPREVQATAVPLNPPLPDGGQVMVVLSDRTRERRLERMRADFVANASHELRTPLASLIGFVETLRGPASDDPAAQQRFLAIMAEQGARMNRLIEDLLSLSRIELMEHRPPADRLDLAELVPPLAEEFEPRLRQRDMRLDLRVAPDLPPVAGDADQIAQVLHNLVDNAVKYGRQGSAVRVALSRKASPLGVTIEVADQGAGIPREHLPRLTERFYRVDKGRSRAMGGTGLGLAIVKHIVNRHRGELVIASEEAVGTTVRVWLPAMPDDAAADQRLSAEDVLPLSLRG